MRAPSVERTHRVARADGERVGRAALRAQLGGEPRHGAVERRPELGDEPVGGPRVGGARAAVRLAYACRDRRAVAELREQLDRERVVQLAPGEPVVAIGDQRLAPRERLLRERALAEAEAAEPRGARGGTARGAGARRSASR